MTLINANCLDYLKEVQDNTYDLIVTDPPYGISFMGKDWDKALPSPKIWQECFRTLKEGKMAFVMCAPRQDVLSRMIISLEDAGFRTNYTSIYWTYASGFPKAANISKLLDKKAGKERPRTKPAHYRSILHGTRPWIEKAKTEGYFFQDDNPISDEAKKMEGAYVGFQPKPAVEVILVVSKGKSLTWLDDCRIPYSSDSDRNGSGFYKAPGDPLSYRKYTSSKGYDRIVNPTPYEQMKEGNQKGRFPANLLVSDDVLNDGRIQKSGTAYKTKGQIRFNGKDYANGEITRQEITTQIGYPDEGSYSRYFDLDKWYSQQQPKIRTRIRSTGDKYSKHQTDKPFEAIDSYPDTGKPITANVYPFIITPKASKSERNKGLNNYITVKLPQEQCLDREGNMVAVQLLRKVTSDMDLLNFSIDESGKSIMVIFPKDSLSIILTEINKIIESKILDLLIHSLIKDYTQDAKLLMVNGGNLVINVENLRSWILTITKESMELALGVSRVTLNMLLRISGKGGQEEYTNRHATVKPLKLMSYLITMGSREGDLVLDPFLGSGTTCIAAQTLNRKYVGIELNKEYYEIAQARLVPYLTQTKLL